jgi:hypothetical protein
MKHFNEYQGSVVFLELHDTSLEHCQRYHNSWIANSACSSSVVIHTFKGRGQSESQAVVVLP